MPVTSWLAQPDGVLEKLVGGVLSTTTYVFTAGSSSAVAPAATIPALSAIYIAFTYAFTGAASAAGQAAGQRDGRDNNRALAPIQPSFSPPPSSRRPLRLMPPERDHD